MTHHLPTIVILATAPFIVGVIVQSIRNALPGIVQLRKQVEALQ